MELNANQINDLNRRFPKFELSYETMAHKKVPPIYSSCLAIPHGKKAFLWFTFFRDDDVCFLAELNRDKRISRTTLISTNVTTNIALGTILYGTVYEQETQKYFVIEDVFYYRGITTRWLPFGEKLGFIQHLFENHERELSSLNNIRVVLPVIWASDSLESDVHIPEKYADSIPYPIHHLQYRSLIDIVPYLNVSFAKKITVSSKEDELLKGIVPMRPHRCDFTKPQYKYTTAFEVKADLQFDIYHLYAYGRNSKREYYGVAYIPNYKTSVYMNGIFRKIKENANLDAIEESDDEDDFQDTRHDKYVDLKKTAVIECQFNSKFKKWVPTKTVIGNTNGKIVHISKL
jgi:hypothetical protein